MKKIILFVKKQKIFIFLFLTTFILLILKICFQKKEPTVEHEKKPSLLEKEVDITKEKVPFVSKEKKEEKKQKEELETLSPSPAKRPTETEGTEEDTRQTLKLYPLIEYLPINNERYHLTYTDPFELTATIKQGGQEEIKKEIINWIISKNIDPSTHKIIFQ